MPEGFEKELGLIINFGSFRFEIRNFVPRPK